MKKQRILGFMCVLLAVPCQGRVITVDNDGPADFNNIQAAINDANNGDTIIVADGTYTGPGNRDIVLDDEYVTIQSANGPVGCIIDCQAGPGDEHFGFASVSPGCVIDGFTVMRGMITRDPLGGGANFFARTVVRNCVFRDNYSSQVGGAIGHSYGFVHSGYTTHVINCVFTGNSSGSSAGAVGLFGPSSDGIELHNCISWANSTPDLMVVSCGAKCGTPGIYADFSILQSDWYGTSFIETENCIVSDPCFADPCNNDYHLRSQAGRWDPGSKTWVQDDVTSIGIDAGNPADPVGLEPFPNGGIVNMGAYGGTNEASKSYFGGPVCQTIVAGDVNGDCVVDFKDFALMALHWLDRS